MICANVENESIKDNMESMDNKDNLEKKEKEIEKNNESNDIIVENDVINEEELFTVYDEDDEKTRGFFHLNKKRKGIVFAVVALGVFVVACYFYLDLRARLDQFDTDLYQGRYDEAKKIYDDFSSKEKKKAVSMIEDKLNQIEDAYYNNENRDVSFTLNKEYKKISVIGFSKKDTSYDEKVEKFEKLQDSEKSYKEAQEAYEKDEYEKAIKKYREVSDQDKYYDDSQEKLKKAIEEYRKEKIDKAEKLFKEEKYDEAIKIIDEGLKNVPKDDELTRKRSYYLNEKLKETIGSIKKEASDYMDKEKYTEAICVLKKAQKDYNNQSEIMDVIDDYKKTITDKIDSCVKEDNKKKAVEIINAYLRADPDDKDMQDKLKEYGSAVENKQALVDMNISDTSGSYYIVDNSIEVFGYENIEKSGQLVVSCKDATKISGVISYSDNKKVELGEGTLTIKAGNEKQDFTLKKGDQFISIEMNIKSAKYAVFEWDTADSQNDNSYGIVLDNLTFFYDW